MIKTTTFVLALIAATGATSATQKLICLDAKDCPSGNTCQPLLGNTAGQGSCVPNKMCGTSKDCPTGFACRSLFGNTAGQGSCVPTTQCWMSMGQEGCKIINGKTGNDDGCFTSEDTCQNQHSPCWMNMGQYGCKVNNGKTGADDGCFTSEDACQNQQSQCRTNKDCPSGNTCQLRLGNTAGQRSCVPNKTCKTCKDCPDNHSCRRGGFCLPTTKCWMSMGQDGCKVINGKTGNDDGCFNSYSLCNKAPKSTKCWMSMGQYGCKVNNGKTGNDDGCFTCEYACQNQQSQCLMNKDCPSGNTCQLRIGNTAGQRSCVPNKTCDTHKDCSTNHACRRGSCVPTTKCWMSMGQDGCKVINGKTGADDGCFNSYSFCNKAPKSTKCWMSTGQDGCKVINGKTGTDDGCFNSEHYCRMYSISNKAQKTNKGRLLRH